MNRDEFEKDLKQMISDSKTLFGDVEETNKDELQEMLNESGRPAEDLRRLVWSSVDAVCKEMRLRGDTPPRRYADVLNQLRPASQPSRYTSVLVQQAQRWIGDLLSGVRKSQELRLQFSFRNRGDLSEEDRRILDEAETEVLRKIERIR